MLINGKEEYMENMSDSEFDLLDELYFVQSFEVIKDSLNWENDLIIQTLYSLYKKEYIKILIAHDVEYTEKIAENESFKWDDKLFLASKKGLLLHNGF